LFKVLQNVECVDFFYVFDKLVQYSLPKETFTESVGGIAALPSIISDRFWWKNEKMKNHLFVYD